MKQLTRSKMTLGILLVLIAWVCFVMSPGQSAKKAVLGQLIDPQSAQFKDIQNAGSHICGAVNAKNSLGGYTGFRRFVYVKEGSFGFNGMVIWEDENPTQFSPFLLKCIEAQI